MNTYQTIVRGMRQAQTLEEFHSYALLLAQYLKEKS